MNIVFAGKGKALVKVILYSLSKIDRELINILPVDSDTGNDWQVSVLKLCELYNLNIVNFEQSKAIKNCVFISVQYDKILKPSEFNTSKIFNIHFSFLPYYKGVYPVVWPILNQEAFSGVTLHFIDAGIDTGNIIDQKKIFLDHKINSFELYEKSCEVALELFIRNFDNLIYSEAIPSQIQTNMNGSYYSKNSLNLSDFKLNFRKTACEVSAQLRAQMFKPYQMPIINGSEIGNVEITYEKNHLQSGKIIEENDQFYTISTIDYIVKLEKDYSNQIFNLLNTQEYDIAFKKIQKYKFKNIKNNLGWTPLMISAYHGNISLCNKLIELGHNVNETNFKSTSVLMFAKSYASKSNNLEILKLLVNNGAQISHKDDYNISLLQYAKNEKNEKVINFLLDQG